MLKPVLIILHQEHSSPGRVGQVLAKLGYPLDIRRPRFGDPLPETMDEHAGAVIFGGPQSANDTDDFLKARDRLDRRAAARQEAVSRHLPGRADDGAPSRRQRLSASARPCRGRLLPDPPDRRPACTICPEWPDHVYQWHREGFDLPAGGELLAEGEGAFAVQAFRYGTGYGIQFHPEVTHAMMYRWLVRGAHRMDAAGRQAARRAHRRPRGARFRLAQLAGRLHRPLARPQAGRRGGSRLLRRGARIPRH